MKYLLLCVSLDLFIITSCSTVSCEDSFIEYYKKIKIEEDKFPVESISTYEVTKSGNTNFISIFQGRFFEKEHGESIAASSSNQLYKCYLNSGEIDGITACRRILQKAVKEHGAIYSVDIFFAWGIKPVISEKEWLDYASKSNRKPSKMFMWIYPNALWNTEHISRY